MRKKFTKVYQIKVTLKDIKPPVWRCIQVPETYTFWDLHVAIQDAMGWSDCHLHEFEMLNPSSGLKVNIGIPDGDFGEEIFSGWKQKIADYFSMENRSADYTYDFGDNWEHAVELEKILPRESNVNYPRCISGKRACPPEDCGGIWGYEEICHGESEFQEEYEDYDPEHFNVKEIIFDDPDRRRKTAFG